jgi:hypothetical protein
MFQDLVVAIVLIIVGALKMWVSEIERKKRADGTAGFWTRNLFEGISFKATSDRDPDSSDEGTMEGGRSEVSLLPATACRRRHTFIPGSGAMT